MTRKQKRIQSRNSKLRASKIERLYNKWISKDNILYNKRGRGKVAKSKLKYTKQDLNDALNEVLTKDPKVRI